MTTQTFTKKAPPEWLLAFWKEIDDKTFGKGFDCFAEDATARLGVAEWNGREIIRESLRAFIDTGFTAHHDVTEYWDGGSLKTLPRSAAGLDLWVPSRSSGSCHRWLRGGFGDRLVSCAPRLPPLSV
jgi:hypothetical protein